MAEWRHLYGSDGSDGVSWKVEQDQSARGRFRLTYSEYVSEGSFERITTRSTLDLSKRIERRRQA